MWRYQLGNAGKRQCALEGSLKRLVVHVMPAHDTSARINRMCVLWKHPEPVLRRSGPRILSVERIRHRHATAPSLLVGTPQYPRARVNCSRKPGARRCGNMTARSFPPLPSRTMIVLSPKSTAFTRSCKPSLIRIPVPHSNCAKRRCSTLQGTENPGHLIGRQNDGEVCFRARPANLLQPWQIATENFTEEEQKSRKRLLMR